MYFVSRVGSRGVRAEQRGLLFVALEFVLIQEPDELFETISQCLLAGVGRDCLAGWGAIVHVM